MRLPTSLRAAYDRGTSERSPYLERARDAAKYTVPTLLPPSGKTSGSRLRHGFSNFGARCVNALSSRYLLALLPARQAFFRYTLDDRLLADAGDKLADIEAALAKLEGAIQTDIDTTPTRGPAGEALKHLIVAGNVLVYDLPEGGLRIYPMDSYVVERDATGRVLSHISEDRVSPDTLPDVIRVQTIEKLAARQSKEKTVSVFTGVFRAGNHWVVWQEVEGLEIPGTRGSYPMEASPWLPLRYTSVPGEHWGRGMVEDYLGYFISLEGLTAALVKGTAALSKLIYLRNPNGTTKARAVTQAETGDVVDGNPTDIQPLQSGTKGADFQQAREMIRDIKEELAYAFALHSAVQRNAERVTAEEIRFMAQDLDRNSGGSYSTFALEFQTPLLRSRQKRLQRQGRLPVLPDKALKPMIVTGLDALGRGAELDNLREFVKDVVDLGGAEALKTYLYFDDLLKRLSTSRGIKPAGLIKPADVVAQESQQQMMQSMVQHLGPNAVTQMGQLAKAGMPAPTGTPQ